MTDTMTERIHDPIHRVSYTFRREGGSLWVSTWLEDGGHLPEHFHPRWRSTGRRSREQRG